MFTSHYENRFYSQLGSSERFTEIYVQKILVVVGGGQKRATSSKKTPTKTRKKTTLATSSFDWYPENA